MLTQNYLYLMAGFLGIFLFLSGCGEDMSSSSGRADNVSKVEGRVTGEDGYNLAKYSAGVENAIVTLVRLEADGSYTSVSKNDVETNVDGEFILETDLENEQGLVVLAVKDTVTFMARVSAEVIKGQTIACQPHNKESKKEAEIYRKHIERQKEDEVCYADVSAYINAETAVELEAEDNKDVEVAAALETESETHNKILLEPEFGAVQNEIESIWLSKNEAQVELEKALFIAAGDESAEKAALDNFHLAVIRAYTDAGINSGVYAKARIASAKAMLKKLKNLNSQSRFKLEQSAALYRAWAIDQACQEQFISFGASNSELNSVVAAGIDLKTSLTSAENNDQILDALVSYNNAIITALQTTVNTQSDDIVLLNGTINTFGGIRSVFQTEIDAATNSDAVIDACLKFISAVETVIDLTLSSATQTETELITEILILINMNI